MADCSTFDSLVVDWLYDELDPAEAARITRHVDGCAACWQTAESLVQVRALMRALPEEEPPAAISARVLREAAAHAASRQGRSLRLLIPAWITGALGRAWAHPAAAAVASLVLVAGVAGALFARDQLEMAAPRIESAAVERDHAQAETGAMPGVMGGSDPRAAMPPAPTAAPPSEMAMTERGDDSSREHIGFSGAQTKTREEKRAAEGARRRIASTPAQRAEREAERGLAAWAGDAEEQLAVPAQDVADEALLGRSDDRGGAGYQEGAGGAGKEAFAQAPAAAAPPQKAAAEPTDRDNSEHAPSVPTGTVAPKPRAKTWAESRHAELRAALTEQQCARAVGIASDIQAREPGYYRAQLASSKELAACRAAGRKAANRAGKPQDRANKRNAADAKADGSTSAE